GVDSEGRSFTCAEEMWREEVGEDDPVKRGQWISEGVGYWEGVEATVNGVLGGYGHVNEIDIQASELFLKSILLERFGDSGKPRRFAALDCGAGIGRVSKDLLIRYFHEVELVEPVVHFLDAARSNLAPENLNAPWEHKATNFFCEPLQEFTPQDQRYDVIWVQWCIGHLSDEDFVSFFKRAKVGLKPGGFFILKENIAKSGFVLDKQDKSITRSDLYFKQLFHRCGLHIYKMKDQRGFPDELFGVKMYALTTEKDARKVRSTRPKKPTNTPAIIK
ncbi:hypothetical protein M569_01434, partial [Genlisea aurea]